MVVVFAATWDAVYDRFITKFFSHQKTVELRGKIATFTQIEGELFHEAWERFKMLLIQWLHHRYTLDMLNQFFYDGLTFMRQDIADKATGGLMWEKIVDETCNLHETSGQNFQQMSVIENHSGVYEENSNSKRAVQAVNLTRQVSSFVSYIDSMNYSVCYICGVQGHDHIRCLSREAFLDYIQEQAHKSNRGPMNEYYTTTYDLHLSWSNDQLFNLLNS